MYIAAYNRTCSAPAGVYLGQVATYNVTLLCCSWWLPETDTYLDNGPAMMVPRFNAATYYDPNQGVMALYSIRHIISVDTAS
jgi:hypothetical protein